MDLEDLIRKKPYLESPLNFYGKVRKYMERFSEARESEEKERDFLNFVIETFCSVFEIPKESLSFLYDEVSEQGIDPFSSPSSFFRLPFYHDDLMEEERSRVLFLLSKPFFLLLRKSKEAATAFKDGKCPICGEARSLARITEDNRKKLLCAFCEYEGDFFRIGCPYCMNRESNRIEILLDEDEVRVELCEKCKSYLKSMRQEHLSKYGDPYLVDIVSLPLDIIAQKKGYVRRSPNIIGLKEIK